MALLSAARRGDVESVVRLIEQRAGVHTTNSIGVTPLIAAPLIAAALIAAALIWAAERRHGEIIEELLKTDIVIDHVNRLAWTALLEAIILGDGDPRHTEVVRLLVEAGADRNLADGSKVTPLEHARRRGYEEMAAILENGG